MNQFTIRTLVFYLQELYANFTCNDFSGVSYYHKKICGYAQALEDLGIDLAVSYTISDEANRVFYRALLFRLAKGEITND